MSKKLSAVSRDNSVILVGGGGHARVLLSILSRLGARVTGYTAPNESTNLNCDYLGTDDFLRSTDSADRGPIVIGVGLPRPDPGRLTLITELLRLEWRASPVVATTAMVADDVELAAAATIFDGSLVATGSTVGVGSIINHRAGVDHDCVIGDNVHIAPGATICGDVQIGRNSMVGAGATIAPGLRIARDCMISAGAVVLEDTKPNSLYAGVPAARIHAAE